MTLGLYHKIANGCILKSQSVIGSKACFLKIYTLIQGNRMWMHLGQAEVIFLFVNMKLNFYEAQSYCIGFGGKLYEPRNETVLEDVVIEAREIFNDEFWLGIHDKNEEGTWVYASDNSPLEFDNWAGGEPSNSGIGEDCGIVENDGGNGGWNDLHCTNWRKSFVCTSKSPLSFEAKNIKRIVRRL